MLSHHKSSSRSQSPSSTLTNEADEILVAMAEPIEAKWREKQEFLASKGYMLRPRYRKDWKPSWEETGEERERCEDSIPLPVSPTIDLLALDDHTYSVLLQAQRELDRC